MIQKNSLSSVTDMYIRLISLTQRNIFLTLNIKDTKIDNHIFITIALCFFNYLRTPVIGSNLR